MEGINLGPVPLSSLVYASVFIAMSLAFMAIGRWISFALTPFNDDVEIRDNKNLAVALRTAGLFVGLVIGMSGALSGSGASFESDVREFFLDGFVVIAALLLAKLVLRLLTLRGVAITQGLQANNLALGLTEFGAFVATGLILNGAFTDEGGNLMGGLIYALIGQLALVLSFYLYEWLSPINVVKQISDGNRAAGLMVGGRLIATGMVLQSAIAGPMTDWSSDLQSFGIYFVFGMVMLAVANWVADLLFLPALRVREAIEEHQNVAAITKVVGVQLAVAAIIMAVM